MDPYLERPDVWSNVHLSLIIYMKDALNVSLPPGYSAVADRYVWIHEPEAQQRTRVKPDIIVQRPHATVSKPTNASPVGTLTQPKQRVLPAVKREGEKFLKILDTRSRRVVTAIELLSPSNKQPGPDREAFLTKRAECLNASVNLVEIDLHRTGQRLPLGDAPIESDYYAMVCRAADAPKADVWEFSLRDRLPRIPIPLISREEEPLLDLSDCFATFYDRSRHFEDIDYTQPCDPPLSDADAQWARDLLRQAGIIANKTT
jgi:hypothetical protein